MRRIIVKEGPLVFLRNVLLMEFIAFLFFAGVSFITNYEMVYEGLGFSSYLRFDLFEIIVFSAFQLVYISIQFLNWYFSFFEIHEKEIVRKTGLLFRRGKSVSMSDVASIEIYQSPLGRMMHHATLIIEHNNGRFTRIKNISNFEEYVHIIKNMVQNTSGRVLSNDPRVLIEKGEGAFIEFKETLRYDSRKGEISKEMEKAVVKTIVGFLNADGGTLLIGVNDNKEIIGLERDIKTLPKKDIDGFENHISMLVKTMVGLAFVKYVNVSFEKVEDKEICIVNVREAHKPAYLTNGDKREDFYVRVGNSTQPYSMSEASEYIKTKWE